MPGKLELRRQLFHILAGFLAIALIWLGVLDAGSLAIMLAAGLLLSLLSLRYRIPCISWFLDRFDRRESLPGFGALTFVAGLFLLLLLFHDEKVIFASIAILAIGDSASVIVGKRLARTAYIRKTRHPFSKVKLLEANLVGALLGAFAAMPFVSIASAILGSFSAMFVEGIEISVRGRKIDDNITVPIVSAAVISIFQAVI